jgi:hypothetical protein
MKQFKIKKDCIINEYFVDSNNPIEERIKYCRVNCGLKCRLGIPYKKRNKK